MPPSTGRIYDRTRSDGKTFAINHSTSGRSPYTGCLGQHDVMWRVRIGVGHEGTVRQLDPEDVAHHLR